MIGSIKQKISRIIRILENIKGLPWEYKIYKRKKSLCKINRGKTSVSDNESGYLTICKLATECDDIFNIFKRTSAYRSILEHVTKQQGQEYLRIIKKRGGDLLKYLSQFKENDKFGNPFTFNYDVGKFSPTTLRYIKVISDLKSLFENLNNLNIVEIGAGYGGQCKIISDVFTPSSYTIVDLELVLPLIRKYLSKFSINATYLTSYQIEDNKEYDLVISNYAFSECIKSVQDAYITKILFRSRKGYLTYNYDGFSSSTSPYNKKELYQILSKKHVVEILEERPRTGHFNFIITWDDVKHNNQ